MSLSGFWKIDHTLSQSQRKLLQKMGKPSYMIDVIDSANETFALFHFKRTIPETKVDLHFIQKDVKIWVTNPIAAMIRSSVGYKHVMKCHGKTQLWKNDEKEFGDCESKSTIHELPENKVALVIEWMIVINSKPAVLKVHHSIDEADRLVVVMELKDDQGSETAVKVYRRYPFEEQHHQYLKEQDKLREYYLEPQVI